MVRGYKALPDPRSGLQPGAPMSLNDRPPLAIWSRDSGIILGLILFQAVCTVFFLGDVVRDAIEMGWSALTDLHLLPEMGATLGLISGIIALSLVLIRLLRRQAHMEQGLNVAQGALGELMEAYFREWGLTPSEQAVAAFTIKGYSIAEIAGLRGSAEATVKTHLNAIYRKAGVPGRAQLVSLLVEDLLRGPLTEVRTSAGPA